MKKVICSVLAIMLLFAGCSAGSGETKIEDYEWSLDIVQDSSNMVIASSEKSSFNTDNKLELEGSAKSGSFYIKDSTNYKTYVIHYTEQGVKDGVTNYNVSINGVDGTAVVSVVENGNNSNPTLYMKLGGYSLRFFPSK